MNFIYKISKIIGISLMSDENHFGLLIKKSGIGKLFYKLYLFLRNNKLNKFSNYSNEKLIEFINKSSCPDEISALIYYIGLSKKKEHYKRLELLLKEEKRPDSLYVSLLRLDYNKAIPALIEHFKNAKLKELEDNSILGALSKIKNEITINFFEEIINFSQNPNHINYSKMILYKIYPSKQYNCIENQLEPTEINFVLFTFTKKSAVSLIVILFLIIFTILLKKINFNG